MAYCGSFPGMCGKQTDCADHHCPGRPLNYASREGGVRITDNGPEFDHSDRCSVCAGRCPVSAACQLAEQPQAKPRLPFWRSILRALF